MIPPPPPTNITHCQASQIVAGAGRDDPPHPHQMGILHRPRGDTTPTVFYRGGGSQKGL